MNICSKYTPAFSEGYNFASGGMWGLTKWSMEMVNSQKQPFLVSPAL